MEPRAAVGGRRCVGRASERGSPAATGNGTPRCAEAPTRFASIVGARDSGANRLRVDPGKLRGTGVPALLHRCVPVLHLEGGQHPIWDTRANGIIGADEAHGRRSLPSFATSRWADRARRSGW